LQLIDLPIKIMLNDELKWGNILKTAIENSAKPIRSHRQHIVVGFSDLSGSTEISSKLEPEIYAKVIGRLGDLFEKIISQYGGEVIRIDGDGATFIFTHSLGQVSAGRRSVEAAIDLHQAMNHLNQETDIPGITLHLHTGIHSGVVLFSPGNITLGKHLILGDATNTSRRLCDLASADQIIVSEQTLGADAHFFKTRQQRVINIRGSQQKLPVLEVVGRVSSPNKFTEKISRGIAPFCGRRTELEKLNHYLDDCLQGSKQKVIIKGNAGLGKTRLINEFINHAFDKKLSAHRGYCEAYLGARTFQPIAQIIHSLLTNEFGMPADAGANTVEKFISKIDPESVTPVMQILSMNAPGAEHSLPDFAEVYRAFLTLLESVKSALPLLLCVDDWQWADGGSERVINAVFSNISKPCLIVFGTREYDKLNARMTNSKVIELNSLADEEAKIVVKGLLNAPGPFVVDRIIQQASGNPLFIEELCHTELRGQGGAEMEDRGAWLESLIHSRFQELTESHAEIVQAASVIGHMIPGWLFKEICGVELGDPVLSLLEEKDFIYTSEISTTLRFKHGITRDAIYSTVGLDRRQATHNRIVEALHDRAQATGEEEELEALSYHYRAGGNAVRAVQYATRAGDRAIAASSLDRAQVLYKSALEQIELLGTNPSVTEQRNALVRKFGLACVVDPSWEQLPVFQQATNKAAATKDKSALAWSEYWLGFILYGLGEARRSISHLEAARRAAELLGNRKQLMQIHATMGQAHAAACEYEPALALLDEVIEAKRSHGSGSRTSVGHSYSISCKAFVLADQGKFEQSNKCFDRAIEILAGEAGKEHEMTTSLLGHRSASCMWQYKFKDAIAYAEEAVKIAERVRARYLFAMNQSLAAAARWELDRDPDALETVVETTNWLTSAASHQYLSLNHGWLAKAMEQTGRIQLARRYAASALLRARKGDRLGEAIAYRALARIANRENQAERANHYIRKAYASSTARVSAHELAKNQICEAELLSRNDQRERACELINSAVDIHEALGMNIDLTGLDYLSLSPSL